MENVVTAGREARGAQRAAVRTQQRERKRSLGRALLVGAAAGLAASAATAVVDRLLDPLVSREQKVREKLVRAGSPHAIAGPRFARALLGRRLSAAEERRARAAFGVAYGLLWGAIYAAVRRAVPQASRAAGLPFGVPFYLACDGAIAPLLGLTPGIHRVPWQLDAKELANHVAWTATAEAVHRVDDRIGT
ncbi:MAG: DUF1440 domain-containing protein [Thermodesulfobacteriota bacterium]